MGRRSTVPPTYSTLPPSRHNDSTGVNRRARRTRVRHYGVYTTKTVWKDWLKMPLNELGIFIRVSRLAKRRGKPESWLMKRWLSDIKRHRQYQQEQAGKLQEIYEQLQHDMLQGEHDHEHGETGTTGTDPGVTDQ